MANHRTLRSLSSVTLAVLFAAGALGCAGTSTAREDYYQSRSIVHASEAGDGSIVAVGTSNNGTAWAATLTMVPLSESGDLAASE